MNTDKPRKKAYRIKEFSDVYGPSPAKTRKEIREGRLEAMQIGRMVFITEEAAQKWWEQQAKPYGSKSAA